MRCAYTDASLKVSFSALRCSRASRTRCSNCCTCSFKPFVKAAAREASFPQVPLGWRRWSESIFFSGFCFSLVFASQHFFGGVFASQKGKTTKSRDDFYQKLYGLTTRIRSSQDTFGAILTETVCTARLVISLSPSPKNIVRL